MKRFIFLDSGPLGLLTLPQRTNDSVAITDWALKLLARGTKLIVPAIVFYEVRRDLLRADKTKGLLRLDNFIASAQGRYLPLSDAALRLAAELWANTRKQGRPTADPQALDVDVILAAQALTFGIEQQEFAVATSNPKHLSLFVPTVHWKQSLTKE